ncbi:uncharacterized protein SPSK_05732 [Sporothrix schenckii 1099-18]|uniref:Uncharacterized protein n=1 Tax=Sporothrix schenckii 1099-18 TaxID=1397361 RepID=A0A0F2LTJ4_SPOSC|nr:uncharacterized protein SPSK_05732 [Sporothrix schenckii 1099-18]KJR80802.1 hypothetical protein SPSK_05732 [Sporothrix schenckii 1099-18]
MAWGTRVCKTERAITAPEHFSRQVRVARQEEEAGHSNCEPNSEGERDKLSWAPSKYALNHASFARLGNDNGSEACHARSVEQLLHQDQRRKGEQGC